MWICRRFARLVVLSSALALICGVLGWRWFDRAPLRQAEAAMASSRWFEGLSLARAYLARRPRDEEARRLAGRCAANLRLFREADQYLSDAGGLLPPELRVHGAVLLELREWERAQVIYTQLVKEYPTDVELRMTLAALSIQIGRYNQAVEHARRAVTLAASTPQEPHCEYLLGNALFVRGDVSEAATHHIRALETQGSGAAKLPVSTESLRLEIVDRLLSVARVEEARQQFALLPTGDAMNLDERYQFGRLCELSDDLPGAQQAWESILSAKPHHFGALFQLGKLNLDRGEAEQARLLLQRAVELAPDNAQAHFLLSQACERTGHRDEAEQITKRFRELSLRDEQERQETLIIRGSPDHRDTQWYLAKRAKRAGDLQLAQMFLRRAMKIDPDFQPAKDLLLEIDAEQQKLK